MHRKPSTDPCKPTTKTCLDCARAREGPAYRLFNPLCQFCGARLLQAIDRQADLPMNKRDRKRAVLTDWLAFGHSEIEIRRLHAGKGLPLAPLAGPGAAG